MNYELRKNKIKINKAGFTLIEMLFVILIMALVGGSLYSAQKNFFSTNEYLKRSLLAEDDTRKLLKYMVSEIRAARQSSTGTYAIESVSASSFIFYSDINGDGKTERIRYFLDGNILKKGVVVPAGDPLSYNLSKEIFSNAAVNVISDSQIFSYYGENYNGSGDSLPSPVNVIAVRLIKINIPVDLDNTAKTATFNITGQVSIRSLKDNL